MPHASKHPRIEFLRTMLRIRAYERELASLANTSLFTACTSLGQEACAAGVVAALESRDRILTNHRNAGHLIARGADLRRMFAEVFGRRDGYCKGKGGPLHLAVKELGIVLTSPVPGGELTMVTGVALAQKLGCGEPRGLVAAFFGDGAACDGAFHESLNLATTWHLPILYVCENNQWQGLVHRREATRAEYVAAWAQKFSVPALVVDGNDVEAVHAAALESVANVRRTGRPHFMELQTYRRGGRVEPDDRAYVDQDELKHWQMRDPIDCLANRMQLAAELTPAELSALGRQIDAEIGNALDSAQASHAPLIMELITDVYA